MVKSNFRFMPRENQNRTVSPGTQKSFGGHLQKQTE